MPTTQKARTARKTQKAKKNVREGVAEKLSHIERALADIRQMVDMNCGEAVLRTARAAGAAAAEEVLTTLAPATAAAAFNTPPAPLAKLPTLAAAPVEDEYLQKSRTATRADAIRMGLVAPKEENVLTPLTQALLDQEKEFTDQAAAPAGVEASKKPGPKLWNEFLRNYIAKQEAAGRKITRLQAMAEAGPNYRAKYGITEKPKRKTAKVAKNLGGVQVAPALEVPAQTLLNRGAVPVKKGVKILAPGNAVAVTPGRPSPPVPLAADAPAEPGLLNTLRTALAGTPPSNSESPVVSSTANTSNAATRPNPNYYGYENLGTENDGTRKVKIAGEDYLMTNQNRGLFRPANGSLEWVGYLEPGGIIRTTNSPE